MEDYQQYIDLTATMLIEYTPKILTALILLVVGLWLIKKTDAFSHTLMRKRGLDKTLEKFLADLINWTLKILLFITVISQLGVATTSLVAMLGAAGLAVGLALQGSLGNFAGGALIMMFKPFRVGDLIEAQGKLGVVKEIQIFVTRIISPDNKAIIIPNGILSNGTIVNYTDEGKIRVDLIIGVSYKADLNKSREVLLDAMRKNPDVMTNPAPSVNVLELADSSVNLAVRPWTEPEKYWDVYFKTMEDCKLVLDENGIEIPFPQRDVHIFNKSIS
ncbi:MAG: mechanosensitive ion channel [Bacteroidetes bacterium]|nr:mechanosensitive ion channel [Bacteroidota bacterium]